MQKSGVQCTKNALTLCIHTLIGFEFLVSKTYLQGGKKNDILGIKKYKKVYHFRVYWGRDFDHILYFNRVGPAPIYLPWNKLSNHL